jgi:hypothetical protein
MRRSGIRAMSIERGPCQITVKSYFLLFLAIYSISNKSRYTIGKALKNAIIGDIFVGQVQGAVQKSRLKRGYFQRPISPGPETPTNGKYEPSTCSVYPL